MMSKEDMIGLQRKLTLVNRVVMNVFMHELEVSNSVL
jgi:hypothetical protein